MVYYQYANTQYVYNTLPERISDACLEASGIFPEAEIFTMKGRLKAMEQNPVIDRLTKAMCANISLTAGSILEYAEALRHEGESILDDLATIRALAGWSDDDARP